MSNTEIIEYGVTDAAIAELKSKFSVVPDASTQKGYADIKSALKIISPYRTGIEAKRKELKADSLTRGRLIDTEAKRITKAILDIEDPFKLAKQSHDDELKAIEEAKADEEAKHVLEILKKLDNINNLVDGLLGADLNQLKSRLNSAKEITVNNVEFEDLIDDAREAMSAVIESLEKAIIERAEYEKQQLEQSERQKVMDKLQAELSEKQAIVDQKEAEQKQKEHDEVIKKEAAEIARIEAEEKAQAEIDAANKREQDQKDAVKAAELKASETEARVKREAEEKIQREKEEAEKRERNKKHKAKTNNLAVDALIEGGMDKDSAKQAVVLIVKRLIPNISISY